MSYPESDDWIFQALCDESLGTPVELADTKKGPLRIRRLLTIARIHRVLGMALQRFAHLAPLSPQSWEIAKRCRRAEIAHFIRVREHGVHVLQAMARAGIRAAIIKGADFADNLYDTPKLRPTNDVDIIVPRNQWVAATDVLKSLGHTSHGRQPDPSKPQSSSGEGSWAFPMLQNTLIVDLHWNLLNSRHWRRYASVEIEDLHWNSSTSRHSTTGELTSASRLVIACVHAACHHQFDKVLHLHDVQRAAWHFNSNQDLGSIRDILDRTNVGAAIYLSLAVTATILKDLRVEQLLSRLRLADDHTTALVPPFEPLIYDAWIALTTIDCRRNSPPRENLRRWLRQSFQACSETLAEFKANARFS